MPRVCSSRPAPLGARLAGLLFDPRPQPNLLPNSLGRDEEQCGTGGKGFAAPLVRPALPRSTLQPAGDRGRARTCNPQLRRLMLYPVELCGHLAPFARHHGSLANLTLLFERAKGGETSRP